MDYETVTISIPPETPDTFEYGRIIDELDDGGWMWRWEFHPPGIFAYRPRDPVFHHRWTTRPRMTGGAV